MQDALSFRVVPQVHGALRVYVAAARRAVETELNAAADNPFASAADQALISNGNFHPMVMAIACNALRIAVAHVGQLAERRLAHLWDGVFEHARGAAPSGALHGLQPRYAEAARHVELRQLAAPATLDVPPLDLGVEDHATGAPLSVRRTDDALALLEDLLAVELLLARDLLAIRPSQPRLGVGTAAVLRSLDEAVSATDPTPDAVHAALCVRLFRP